MSLWSRSARARRARSAGREMRYELVFDPELECIEVRAEGEVSLDDVASVTREVVKHPEWRSGMAVLADYRSVEGYHLRSEDVRELAALMKPLAAELGEGRLALLLDGTLMYGLARMWSVYASFQFSMEVRVFTDEGQARAWLI